MAVSVVSLAAMVLRWLDQGASSTLHWNPNTSNLFLANGDINFRDLLSLITAQRVIGGHLDQDNLQAVGILDPHLGQAPWLYPGLAQNSHACGAEPLMLRLHVPHLEPDHHRLLRSGSPVPGDFQQPSAQEEHRRRVSGGTELPVDGQAQHIAVELPAPAKVGRAEQNPAAEYIHPASLPAEAEP